jgi:hypothetical protein
LAVIPLIIFLTAAPFHVADTGTSNLFFTIALGTNLVGFTGHDYTSIKWNSSGDIFQICPLSKKTALQGLATDSRKNVIKRYQLVLIKYTRKIKATRCEG